MKIRNGFVSNSSSSSFIVFKPVKEMNGTKEEVIKKFILNSFGIEDEDEFSGNYFKEIYDKLIEKSKNIEAFELIDANIEYGGEEDLESLLNKLDIKYIFTE